MRTSLRSPQRKKRKIRSKISFKIPDHTVGDLFL